MQHEVKELGERALTVLPTEAAVEPSCVDLVQSVGRGPVPQFALVLSASWVDRLHELLLCHVVVVDFYILNSRDLRKKTYLVLKYVPVLVHYMVSTCTSQVNRKRVQHTCSTNLSNLGVRNTAR